MSHSLALKKNKGKRKSALINLCTLYHHVSLYKTAHFNYGRKGDSVSRQSVNPQNALLSQQQLVLSIMNAPGLQTKGLYLI